MAELDGDEYTSDGLTIQKIQKHRTTYDWDGIKKAIGIMNWKKIVRETPDPKLLYDAIARGIVKPEVVAQFQTDEPLGEPHIKIDKARKEEVGESI